MYSQNTERTCRDVEQKGMEDHRSLTDSTAGEAQVSYETLSCSRLEEEAAVRSSERDGGKLVKEVCKQRMREKEEEEARCFTDKKGDDKQVSSSTASAMQGRAAADGGGKGPGRRRGGGEEDSDGEAGMA